MITEAVGSVISEFGNLEEISDELGLKQYPQESIESWKKKGIG